MAKGDQPLPPADHQASQLMPISIARKYRPSIVPLLHPAARALARQPRGAGAGARARKASICAAASTTSRVQ